MYNIEENKKFAQLREQHHIYGNIKKAFREHPISLMLHKANYTRKEIRLAVGVSAKTYNIWMLNPRKFFTLDHYERLSVYIDVDLYEVIDFIRTKKKSKAWWFEV